MIYVLDANVLIALGDANHPHRTLALDFFARCVAEGWATCPLTENAFIRILGKSNYPSGPGTTTEARRLLKSFKAAPGHQFWPDSLSLCDANLFPTLPPSPNLTNIYLLALAVQRGGKLATFDQGINASLVPGGIDALHVLQRESEGS